jgi:hypothetical protein
VKNTMGEGKKSSGKWIALEVHDSSADRERKIKIKRRKKFITNYYKRPVK